MFDQIIQVVVSEWSRDETIRLLMALTALFLAPAIWGAIPRLRRSGMALLVLFSLFTGLYELLSAYELVFDGVAAAARLDWPSGPFAIQLGFFHAACGAGLIACLILGRPEWTRGLLIALALYASSSSVIHLVEVFGHDRIRLPHLGPSLWHDILFVVLVFWVVRKVEERDQAVYYVPR